MWTALTLVVLAASSPGATPPPVVELTPGTKVRLSAGPVVHVPGLFSGTEKSYVAGRYERSDGLLVFTREDGSLEAVIAPGATVEGTLAGADPTHVHLRRGEEGPPESIHRLSVARVTAVRGSKRKVDKGAMVGGVTGAALVLGATLALSRPGTDMSASPGGVAVATVVGGATGVALGALVGALSTGNDWREVPLESLSGPVGNEGSPPPASGHPPAAAESEGVGSWSLVSVGSGGDIAVGIVRTGPLKRAVAALGRLEGTEGGEGRED